MYNATQERYDQPSLAVRISKKIISGALLVALAGALFHEEVIKKVNNNIRAYQNKMELDSLISKENDHMRDFQEKQYEYWRKQCELHPE
ncbi:hypothetical protein J4406_01970 [Candidatus Woesearchaeota archaeon]|nr:hypothetical protein [Candidatus Woesearchaeota archaeon]